MKFPLVLAALCLSLVMGRAATIEVSRLDSAKAELRESKFIPWSTREESSKIWKLMAKENVPIYLERKVGFSRDIYIPNPGTAYWVLGNLSEEKLLKTHREKLKIRDALISCSVWEDPESGVKRYWALWAPAHHAELLTSRMEALGISQAQISLSWWDDLLQVTADAPKFMVSLALGSLGLNVVLLVLGGVLFIRAFEHRRR